MADQVHFEVDGFAMADAIGAIRDRLMDLLLAKMNSLMEQLKNRIVTVELGGSVLNTQTGTLASTVKSSAGIDRDIVVGEVQAGGPEAPYGSLFMKGGSADYLIYPTTKKALAFMMGADKVIVKGVLHPAAQKRDFMTPAFNDFSEIFNQGMADAANEALR